jgi:hypothetical protein
MAEENSPDRILEFIADESSLLHSQKPDSKEGTGMCVPQTEAKSEVTPWKKAYLEQLSTIPELKPELAFSLNKPSLPVKPVLEPDAVWRRKLVHPSIALVLGKRGNGKSALGYRLNPGSLRIGILDKSEYTQKLKTGFRYKNPEAH